MTINASEWSEESIHRRSESCMYLSIAVLAYNKFIPQPDRNKAEKRKTDRQTR